MSEKVKRPGLWTALFAVVSLAWVFPIVLVVVNSFKQKAYISRDAFSIPTGKAFVGLENYTRGVKRTNLVESFGWTVVVTVGAVGLILLCTSMCAWWIVRVNNRWAKALYLLFLFNMIVPFQMVMFTLSKIGDDRRGERAAHLLPDRVADHASLGDFGGDPAGDVDLERLPAAVSDPGHAPVQDHVDRDPVSQGRVWFGGHGRDDGLSGAGHHPDHRVLPGVPEVHHQGRHGRSRQRLMLL